jgi:lysophospholipase L1-like esterase
MRDAGPTLTPDLPPEAFFARDPVHLTASGHRALAQAVAEGLRP